MSQNDSYFEEAKRVLLEARDQIQAYRRELFDPGGALVKLSDTIVSLKTQFEANWELLHGAVQGMRAELNGHGIRLGRVEEEIALLKQQLTSMSIRLSLVETPKIAGVKVPNGPVRVLIVEDADELQRSLHRLLRGEGMEVTSVSTIEEAKQKFDALDIEIVLSDVVLPGENGVTLLRWISEKKDRIAEVIMMSAYNDTEQLVELLKLGAYSFLDKPFRSIQEVVFTIQRAAEKRRLRLLRDRILSAEPTSQKTG